MAEFWLLTNANTSDRIRRERHDKPGVEVGLVELDARHIRIDVRHNGHVWGRFYCPCGAQDHQGTVYSTPQNPENHGKNLISTANRWEREHQDRAKERQGGAKR